MATWLLHSSSLFDGDADGFPRLTPCKLASRAVLWRVGVPPKGRVARSIRAGGAIFLRVNDGAPQATTIQGAVSHVRSGHLQHTPIPQPCSRQVALSPDRVRRKPCRQERPVGATDEWRAPLCGTAHRWAAQDAALRSGRAQCPHAANRRGACACRTSHPRQPVSCTRRQKGLEKPESRLSANWLNGHAGNSSATSCGRSCSVWGGGHVLYDTLGVVAVDIPYCLTAEA